MAMPADKLEQDNAFLSGLIADAAKPAPSTPRPAARPRAIKEAAPPRLDYEGTALRLGEIAALLVWGTAWVVDANFTAQFFVQVFSLTFVLGVVAHLVVSFIQHHYGKSLKAQRDAIKEARQHGERVPRIPLGDTIKVWALVLTASAFNAMTTVIGMWIWSAARVTARPFDILGMLVINVPASPYPFWACLVIGTAIALFAERELVRLARRLIAQWSEWRASWI